MVAAEAGRARAALRAFGEHLAIGALPQDVGTTIDSMLAAAQRELDLPVVYLSTFTETQQVVLRVAGDGSGLGIHEGLVTGLEETWCARMVRGGLPNVVVDTRRDPHLADLPTTRAGAAAYAGVPLHLPSGHVIGSLCGLDRSPRPDLQDKATAVLRAVAELVAGRLADLHAETADREALVRRVHAVLEDPNRMQPAFQPVVDLRSGDVVAVEALTRFEDHDLRSPDVWFAEAASIGMGVRLEVAAAQRALACLGDVPDGCTIAVNLSPEAITPGTLDQVLDGVEVARATLELTEHAAIDDYDGINRALRTWRRRGLGLAIDDVGAGFANMRHVLQTAPDAIKLDRSLVGQLATDRAKQAVVAAFARMAQELGATVIAEGVEDDVTRDLLVEAGVHRAQGWLFEHARSLPLPRLSYAA